MWECKAEYADGTTVERLIDYNAGSIREDNQTQYDLECWLLSRHPDCTWYSVNYVEEA